MEMINSIKSLAGISSDHPCLWGDFEVRDSQPLQTWHNATLLPPRRRKGQTLWWRRYGFGAFDDSGQHLRTLSDMRGKRHCCHPASRLEDNPYKENRLVEHEVVLYGGTLYDHIGHLILDGGRAYQLLHHYRDSKLPIWFHEASPNRHGPAILKLALVQDWFKQLGLRKRAKLIRRPMLARQLVSGPALCCDRSFASRDLRTACVAALKPRLRHRLETISKPERRLAYLSRHKLSQGSTHFAQEAELVAQLSQLPNVDIICPEELNFEQKLNLYRRYEIITGFPQACMTLKMFVPGEQLAQQVMFLAGARSLSSTWVNLDRATDGEMGYFDCGLNESQTVADDPRAAFQRSNQFNAATVLRVVQTLSR